MIGVFVKAQKASTDFPECVELSPTTESKLVIEVRTNVNAFECVFDQDAVFKELNFQGLVKDQTIVFDDGLLDLPVLDFDCGGELINKDFADLLDYPKHSTIQVEFLEAHWYSPETQKRNIQRGLSIGYFTVELTIGGHSQQKRLHIFSSHFSENTLFSRGAVDLNLTEFGIKPPVKFFGMVKVKDELTIRFDLKIKMFS